MSRNYRELSLLQTFEERFEYLRLSGLVGKETFGGRRYLNQSFYSSIEWKRARRNAIARDSGCDLGIPGYEIYDRLYVHHISPLKYEDLVQGNFRDAFSIDNLITVSFDTYERIHYGSSKPSAMVVERKPGDTKLW